MNCVTPGNKIWNGGNFRYFCYRRDFSENKGYYFFSGRKETTKLVTFYFRFLFNDVGAVLEIGLNEVGVCLL